jgi:hypothetical protein
MFKIRFKNSLHSSVKLLSKAEIATLLASGEVSISGKQTGKKMTMSELRATYPSGMAQKRERFGV